MVQSQWLHAGWCRMSDITRNTWKACDLCMRVTHIQETIIEELTSSERDRLAWLERELADREAQLAVYDKIVPDAVRIRETTAKLARVEALAPKLRKRASGPGGSSCCRDTWVLALREIATELEAALKGGEHT